MRVRVCWILLGGALVESIVASVLESRGDLYFATCMGVVACVHLIWFLRVEQTESVEGVELW